MASSHSSPAHTVWPHPAGCHPHALPPLERGREGERVRERKGEREGGNGGCEKEIINIHHTCTMYVGSRRGRGERWWEGNREQGRREEGRMKTTLSP